MAFCLLNLSSTHIVGQPKHSSNQYIRDLKKKLLSQKSCIYPHTIQLDPVMVLHWATNEAVIAACKRLLVVPNSFLDASELFSGYKCRRGQMVVGRRREKKQNSSEKK